MKHIVICDDDLLFSNSLASQVRGCFSEECAITLCGGSEDLQRAVSSCQPDIVFMDIELDTDSGIALVRELFPADGSVSVIFVTGHIEYCTDVYETDHIYFLVKPVDEDHLKKALDKACRPRRSSPVLFAVQSGGATYQLRSDRLMYVESFYRKLRFVTADVEVEAYGALSSLPVQLQQRMLHCHKSYLVNMDYISAMEGDRFLLTDGSTVPISHSCRTESRRRFLEHISRKEV